MIMKIKISNEKARKNGKTTNYYYELLDQYFRKRNLFKIDKGIYQCNEYGKMAAAQVYLTRENKWYLNVVETWHCNFLDNELDQHMENCLVEYYQYQLETHKIKQIPEYVLAQM